MAKSLFNFYLDDDKKVETIAKLNRICGEENKGQLASYLRVCVNMLLTVPDDKVKQELIEAIKSEYVLTTKSNKRSRN